MRDNKMQINEIIIKTMSFLRKERSVNKKTSSFSAVKLFSALFFCTIVVSFPVNSYADGGCNTSCSAANECQPASKNGIMTGTSGPYVDANCVKNNSASSCFNGYPISASNSGGYNTIGYRPNGAGGNSKPRNHYGSDLGTGGLTNVKAFAPADGEVAYTGLAGGSGRTMVINHKASCQGSWAGGNGGYFHTVSRHLFTYDKSGAVKKDEVIGTVGGSNFTRASNKFCDNPAQAKGCTKKGTDGYYDIHLHLEVKMGKFSGSDTSAKVNNVLQPYCTNLGVLCGDCAKSDSQGCVKNKQMAAGAIGDTASAMGSAGSGSDVGGADRGSSGYCEYTDYLDSDSCNFCGLFRTIFNAASSIALMANRALTGPTLSLVKIGFLIWLAVYLLKNLGSFAANNSGEMAKGILFQGFRVAVVAFILSTTTALFYIMDITLNPVMQTGLNFANSLNDASTCSSDADYMQDIKGYDSTKGYADTSDPSGGLSTNLGQSIICSIKNLEASTSILMSLGRYSICLSVDDSNMWLMGIMPHLGYLTTGIFLLIAGLGLLLMFPWCLVDCVLQLCISAAMIPCAIGAYAFKSTAKYLKIIWNFFMNAMFNFVFLAIIIYIINQQFQSWIGINTGMGSNGPNEDPTIFIRFSGLAWYGMGAIRVGAVCFFCYVFFDEAKTMAEKFADSPGLGGNQGIGRMVGGTMSDMAGKTGKAAVQTLWKGTAKAVGAGANALAGNAYRNVRNHAVGALASRIGRNSSTSVDANGKVIGHKGSFRVFGRDINVSASKDADGKWTLTRESHKRSQSDKAFEKVLDQNGNEMKDANGNVMYRARHRTLGKVTGYEAMTASKDANGNLVYSTADGKSQFVLDENGQISAYKTKFTNGFKSDLKQFGTNRITNTSKSRTEVKLDAYGNVTGSQTKMQDFNLYNRNLIKKDGSINLDTFNEMQRNAQTPEQAAQMLVTEVMKARGIALENQYQNRKVTINNDGSVTLLQTNKDGSTKEINAVMMGNQMVIDQQMTTVDEKTGVVTGVVKNRSNGIRTEVQTITRQKNGTYTYDTNFSYNDYIMKKNSFLHPLNHKGQWGNNIDRDKAMQGFSDESYNKEMAALNVRHMKKTMSTGQYNSSSAAASLHSQVHGENMTLDQAKNMMK